LSEQKPKADPYLLLLGISPTEDRTNYRLLDVPVFEPDIDVIERGRNRRNAALRQIRDGDLLADSERIKEEIANAFRCLCNPEARKAYDTRLREDLDQLKAKIAAPQPKPDPGFGEDVRQQQIQHFREAVRKVFADGIVEQSEKEHLQQLHLKLGVSAEEARDIFAEIAKETQAKVQRELERRRIELTLEAKRENEAQARVQRELERRRVETELEAKRENESRDLHAAFVKLMAKVPPSVPH